MKKLVFQVLVCIVSFSLSLVIVSVFMNQGNTDMTAEMGKATLPYLYMSQGGDKVNCLYGYVDEMRGNTMRECITPLGTGRNLTVTIEKMGCRIRSLSFEVRSVDGSRLVEDTEIYDYTEEKDTIETSFSIKDLIEPYTEYNLILKLEEEGGRTIRYYTRIIQADNYFAKEKLAFVKEFHNKTYDKEAARDLTMYLESNAEGDNSTFAHVDIHSSFQQITWGNLQVREEWEPVYTIREIGPSTANIRVIGLVGIGEGKEKKYYNVEEFYRIRYTPERTYLLNFQRDMHQIFDRESGVFVNNKIMLGINDADVEMMESDGGNVLAFVNENRLYSYNISDNKFADLFGFYDRENMDRRTVHKGHGVKILSVDETENVQFMVYGYMNRGRHEGRNGIQVCYYNSMLNVIEEKVFIPDNRSFEMIEADIRQLVYADNNSHLYLMLTGSLYEINLEEKNYRTVVSDLREGRYQISESNRMIVWKNERNNGLTLMNLGSKKQIEINAGNSIMLSPLGFMGEDLIYGMTRVSDIVHDRSGKVIMPMYEIRIQGENDEILKKYHKENIYVLGAQIRENQITLDRVEKDEEAMQFIPVAPDQIMNNEDVTSGSNIIETAVTEEYETLVQIAVKGQIDKKTIKFLTPKEVLFEGRREVTITPDNTNTSHYFVYGLKKIEGVYTDPGNAVTCGEAVSGVVTNDAGAYVWKAGDKQVKNQIMKITGSSVDEERGSLAVCLDTILNFEGVPRNTSYMLEQGETAVEILERNLEGAQVLELSGCSLNSVLYYVNRDIPVLATLNDGNAVLIVGFNELNTVLMDPLAGEVYKKGINDSTEWFEENGNGFITYIR